MSSLDDAATPELPKRSKTSNEAPVARKYRSRKQKPCDNCRRRRICCVRDAEGDCALCSRRSIPCTFSSAPSPRRRPAKLDSAPSTTVVHKESATSPADTRESHQAVAPEQKSRTEGKYIGLSGTDDVYFVVDRGQAIGNDPAHEAYFRERTASLASVSSGASQPLSRSIEPDASIVRTVFFEQSHPAYPLLEANLVRNERQSKLLAIAITIITKYTSPELEGLNSNILIEKFTASLLLEARVPSLETVEAAILFTQRALRGKMYDMLLYDQLQADYSRSTSAPGLWASIGTIVGMSHEIGLNIDCSTWNIPAVTRRRRKRLWWATYMQDKWYTGIVKTICAQLRDIRFAMALGRPSYLNDANSTVLLLTPSDFEDAMPNGLDGVNRSELIAGIHCFVAMAALTVILNEILSMFFTISSVVHLREVSGEHIIEASEKIEAKLVDWRTTHLDPVLVQRFFPDVTGSLEISYLTVRVMLLRGIIPKLYRRNFPLDTHVDRAVEVTSGAINLVETLQINRLSAFWWSCSGYNFALVGTLMASLKQFSTDAVRANYWDDRLAYYRKLLSAHGMSFWPARFAATALDVMAKQLTKATDADTTDDVVGRLDALTSPETSWSGMSSDFVPNNFTLLNESDLFAEWAEGSGFQWQSIEPVI